ncbi:STAS domain-containing protein [Mucilaginibacter polytrichastri]|uniref:Putative anti-sigma factor antagonist n=1 Tax=Mucilaginibacter polytrichastri TaxID=1302689 RepID=A0A1Q5ZVZ2_9SPHI|nr:STAS domain-containing protein [Mucilaginibacter polytrichastri]OKS85929.1 Putative anti-sigma factor antagonist [Mucilaginibacter polytrichastri]
MIDIIKNQSNYLLVDVNLNEANMGNAAIFKSEIISMLDLHHKKIILSLHQVNYIDSTFLGALVAALKHAISLKADIALVGLKKDIHDLLTLIRLDKVFKIYDSFNDATKED